MAFNTISGTNAGKLSKRGKCLPINLRNSLNSLAEQILKDIELEALNTNQRIKLLDIILKHTLPKLTIEKNIENDFQDKQITIQIIDTNGKIKE